MVMFIVVLTLFSVAYTNAEPVIVNTTKGSVQGFTVEGYNTFFGVPYARVNEENPFGSTEEYPNFTEPFVANDSSVVCPQVYFSDKGILQCLRLNIYAPLNANDTNPVPILVWFHGGGFAFGSGGEYSGKYLVKHDIMVITVNYRLGPYGFLCLNEATVPGNQGLKDQIIALRWIQKNIAPFGGDPEKVTIAGESYGGGAVDMHLYSKYETLFHRAIIQSGSMYVTEGFFVKPDYDAAIKIADQLGEPVLTTEESLKKLAEKSPAEVSAAVRNLTMILALCKEEQFQDIQNFITEDPFRLEDSERIKNMAIMIGYNSQEMLYEFVNKPKEFYDNLTIGIPNQLQKTFVFDKDELDALTEIVTSFYLGGKPVGPESQLELSDFLSDFAINYGAEWSVNRFVEQGAKVYKYLFSYIGASQYKNVTNSGAMHTEELKFLFDWVWAEQLSGPEQLLVRDRMTTMWANFVKYGNPTPNKTDLLPVEWTPVTGTARPYMDIDVNLSMKDSVYRRSMAFWDLFWHSNLQNHVLMADEDQTDDSFDFKCNDRFH